MDGVKRERDLLNKWAQTLLVELGLIEEDDLSVDDLLMVLEVAAKNDDAVLEQWRLRRELIRKTRSGKLKWEKHERYPDIYICHLEEPYRLRLVEEGGDLLQLDDGDYPHGRSETVFVYAGDKLLQTVKQAIAGEYPTIVDNVRTMI